MFGKDKKIVPELIDIRKDIATLSAMALSDEDRHKIVRETTERIDVIKEKLTTLRTEVATLSAMSLDDKARHKKVKELYEMIK